MYRPDGNPSVLIAGTDPDLVRALRGRRPPIDVRSVSPTPAALRDVWARPHLVVLARGLRPATQELVRRACRDDPALARVPLLAAGHHVADAALGVTDAGTDLAAPHAGGTNALAERIVAAVSRAETAPADAARSAGANSEVRVGQVAIDPERYRVTVCSGEVRLTAAEFRLLLRLARNAGRILSAEQLAESSSSVVGGVATTRSIRTRIHLLRRKLGQSRDQLQTVRDFGYRLSE